MNDKEVDDQRWYNLVTGSDFYAVRDYLNSRKEILLRENTALSQDQDFSTLVKIGANLARINEIDALIKKADFKYKELSNGRK